jgi:molybdenum cofactor biosynthesis protein B
MTQGEHPDGTPAEHKAHAPASVGCYVLTVSDSRTPDTDTGGRAIRDLLQAAGHAVTGHAIVKDDAADVVGRVRAALDDPRTQVIITTGGTGITSRDGTFEAIDGLLDKRLEGFGELFRMLSYQKVGTSTIQSRTTGGVAGGTYLFALPGSPGACRDGWEGVLKHQLDSRHLPCNLVELMPRLLEHLTAGG